MSNIGNCFYCGKEVPDGTPCELDVDYVKENPNECVPLDEMPHYYVCPHCGKKNHVDRSKDRPEYCIFYGALLTLIWFAILGVIWYIIS